MRKVKLWGALLLAATGAAAAIGQTGILEIGEDPAVVTRAKTPTKPLDIPKEIEPKLSALGADQLAFLKSGESVKVVPSAVMFARFEKLTPAEVADYVAALISVRKQLDFQPGKDKPTIALDTSSPMFNAWTVERPAALNPKREPGTISLNRYVGGWGGGIPTFAGAPVALTPEDLKAGKVQVAIVGAPLDMGSGWRDAKNGPLALRTAMGAQAPFGNDMYSMIDPGRALRIADYGDIAVDNLSTERSVVHVRQRVAEIARAGAIPIVIGGDHSLEYPDVAAMADVYGKGKVGVVHFDSHYDAASDRVHLLDHGQPVYRVIHEGHVLGKNYVQVGLRARGPDIDTFKWMREQGMQYHTMVEVEKSGWDKVMEEAVSEARRNTDKLWISFDIDVLDPRSWSAPARRFRAGSPCAKHNRSCGGFARKPTSSAWIWSKSPPTSTPRIARRKTARSSSMPALPVSPCARKG
jgi:agmatinase